MEVGGFERLQIRLQTRWGASIPGLLIEGLKVRTLLAEPNMSNTSFLHLLVDCGPVALAHNGQYWGRVSFPGRFAHWTALARMGLPRPWPSAVLILSHHGRTFG